jgi:type I restriction enzyme S subunit
MRGEGVRKFMFKRAQGSTRFNLSKTTVKEKMRIVLPGISEQKEIAQKLDFMENNVSVYEGLISKSQSLQKSLINQIF